MSAETKSRQMMMPGRNGEATSSSYRYGFQGQERDDEIKGAGNSVNYMFRMYDPRLGKFLSTDPLHASYPHNSPYAFSENIVVNARELEGLEVLYCYYIIKDGLMKPMLDKNGSHYTWAEDQYLLNQYHTNQRILYRYFVWDDKTKMYKFYEDDYDAGAGSAIIYDLQTDGVVINEREGYELPSAGELADFYSERGHLALDMMGAIPIVGELADLVNGVWYHLEGDRTNAYLSYGAAIPFLGWAAVGTKYAVKTSKYSGEIVYNAAKKTDFDATFVSKSGDAVGIVGETTKSTDKVLHISDVAFYGQKASGEAMDAGDLSAKTLLEYRTSIAAWAKENGYEKVVFTGKRAENSSSANLGMELNWEIDLTK